ncbi:CLUMA_CG006511, isoform A [Clunio marinus]|uniref:CLUMA_CG006511, isoform A n=1 Tax=Clunio marinus TaxID=568069 RepID=A0A1J1HXX5_9DIPT|nr:CLUMA_CG006511, isoform A [Clunio marinus]
MKLSFSILFIVLLAQQSHCLGEKMREYLVKIETNLKMENINFQGQPDENIVENQGVAVPGPVVPGVVPQVENGIPPVVTPQAPLVVTTPVPPVNPNIEVPQTPNVIQNAKTENAEEGNEERNENVEEAEEEVVE